MSRLVRDPLVELELRLQKNITIDKHISKKKSRKKKNIGEKFYRDCFH